MVALKPAASARAAPLSVVICCRDEAASLPSLLADLALGPELVREVLVVDGGSRDGSPGLARLAGARVLQADPCRGAQLALGASRAEAPWLLLLHADLRLPGHWPQLLQGVIHSSRGGRRRPVAWAFRLAIRHAGPALHLVEGGVLLRCLLRQQPYGDQGLLLQAASLRACGGIQTLPLMEDLDLVLRLARLGPIRLLAGAVQVSERRWRRLGVWRTTWTNARLRRQWRRGASAELLAASYRGGQPGDQEAYQNAQRRCSGSSSQP
ncbi:MAG: TIGR04283 family arsenosugar biosynthesis glycosyltransferase [Synechococcaceae cyanobacterium]|nr:TIGR04283 family arsenosugar biosynthesis glycosyltransferase [Synechococcaceae cyanobacterium]